MTPERREFIRAYIADVMTRRSHMIVGEAAVELLDELDAVTRERDEAQRERDEIGKALISFTGAPTLDEALDVVRPSVEWDAIASYHGVTISEGRKRGRRAASEESRSPGLDWVSENGGT
jgi:hypothetical protein